MVFSCIFRFASAHSNKKSEVDEVASIRKIGIIGCGNVGMTTAYTLMVHGLCTEMVLIDVNTKKAESEAMDLGHCLPFLSPMQIYAGDYTDLLDAQIIIIAAGVGQKPGETRIDLVHRNADIFSDILRQIVAVNTDCLLLIVSNPVDILTYVALKASGFPASRVIGTGTVLDTARLKYLVGEKLGVDYRNVHSFIIGEHGDSELAVWSGANVSGINIADFCLMNTHSRQRFGKGYLFRTVTPVCELVIIKKSVKTGDRGGSDNFSAYHINRGNFTLCLGKYVTKAINCLIITGKTNTFKLTAPGFEHYFLIFQRESMYKYRGFRENERHVMLRSQNVRFTAENIEMKLPDFFVELH